MKPRLLFFALLLAFAGCKPAAPMPSDSAPAKPQTYAARGVVQKISPGQLRATIKHEAIPGYMGAMTMEFPALDTNVLNGISPGD
jgi:protein SCO1